MCLKVEKWVDTLDYHDTLDYNVTLVYKDMLWTQQQWRYHDCSMHPILLCGLFHCLGLPRPYSL